MVCSPDTVPSFASSLPHFNAQLAELNSTMACPLSRSTTRRKICVHCCEPCSTLRTALSLPCIGCFNSCAAVFHRQIPMPFDLAETLVRMARKYKAEHHYGLAISSLKTYPSTKDEVTRLHNHPKWKESPYDKPSHLIRLIHLLESLDTRDLDHVAAMAFYKLAAVDWSKSNKADTLQELSPATLVRLVTGQQRFQKRCADVVGALLEHPCLSSQSCRNNRKAQLKNLITAMHGDFLEALSKTEWCEAAGLSVHETVLLRFISVAWGFEEPPMEHPKQPHHPPTDLHSRYVSTALPSRAWLAADCLSTSEEETYLQVPQPKKSKVPGARRR